MVPLSTKRNVLRRTIGTAVLLILLTFVFWYVQAGDFSDSDVSGTYILQQNDETSTLILRPDHSFQQEVVETGKVTRADGIWRVSGEGHIAFSAEFLRVHGEQVSPAGQAYGQIHNWFGLVSITLPPDPSGPRFRRKLFR